MSAHRILFRSGVAGLVLAAAIGSLLCIGSCARTKDDDGLVLKEDVYGFLLGQTREAVFKRSEGIATITRAPDPPLGYRGDLFNFSAPLEGDPEIDHVRCAFLRNRLMEVIVYFRDTSDLNLDRLKHRLEQQYGAKAVAEDSRFEMARKTYRLKGPSMAITLRRIAKIGSTELYIQYLHDELHTELIEMNKKSEKR